MESDSNAALLSASSFLISSLVCSSLSLEPWRSMVSSLKLPMISLRRSALLDSDVSPIMSENIVFLSLGVPDIRESICPCSTKTEFLNTSLETFRTLVISEFTPSYVSAVITPFFFTYASLSAFFAFFTPKCL